MNIIIEGDPKDVLSRNVFGTVVLLSHIDKTK